ncbi:MAG: CHAT domain-containing protein [Bacteroidales bacterium]|nr:CHAT domain-containing protein [Bacteroidales bacterium]
MKSYFLLIILFLGYYSLYAEVNTIPEEKIAKEFYNGFQFDSAAVYYKKATEIRMNENDWGSTMLNYRYLALSYYHHADYDSSFIYTQKALGKHLLDSNIVDSKLIAEHLEIKLIQADLFNIAAKFDSALMVYNQVLNLNKVHNSDNVLFRIKTNVKIGFALRKQSNYTQALDIFQSMEDTLTTLDLDNDALLSNLYYCLGIVYQDINKSEKARSYFENALTLQKKLYGEVHYSTAKSYRFIGTCHKNEGEYEKAEKLFEKSLMILKQTRPSHHPDLAHLYNSLARNYTEKGDLEKSLQYFFKSLDIIKKGNNTIELAKVYSSIGVNYVWLMDYYKALDYFNKSLPYTIQDFGKKHVDVAYCYVNMAVCYGETGNYDLSIEYNNKALEICKEIFGEESMIVANIYGNIGLALAEKNDCEEALKYLDLLLKKQLQEFPVNHPSIARSYYNIATVYRQLNEFEKALAFHKKGLSIRRNVFNEGHMYISDTYFGIGLNHFLMNNYDTAIGYFHKALRFESFDQNFTTFEDSTGLFDLKPVNSISNATTMVRISESYFHKYNLEHSIDNLTNAIKYAKYAYQVINNLRNQYSKEESKLLLTHNYKNQMDFTLLAAHELYKSKASEYIYQAFHFVENSKALTLASLLNESKINKYADVPDSLITQIRKTMAERNYLQMQINNNKYNKQGYDTIKMHEYENDYFYYTIKYDSLIESVENNYPNYYQLKYGQKYVKVEDIQKVIGEHTAMLNYYTNDSCIFIFIITDSLYKEYVVSIDEDFASIAGAFNKDIRNVNIKGFLTKSTQLYNKLIRPVEDEIKDCNKLVIVPDDYLFYIPFEALVKQKINPATKIDFTELDYLVKKYSIVYHNSANLWYKSFTNSVNNQRMTYKNSTQDISHFIGFAPIFDKNTSHGYIKASNFAPFDSSNYNLTLRSLSSNGNQVLPLPYTENELNTVIQLFENKDKFAKGYFHNKASEKNFVDNCKNYKYIHLATHGFANDEHPSLSGIVFSQPTHTAQNQQGNIEYRRNKYTYEDGILYTGEVYNLRLNADLVVLSSCESGIGKLIKGEGMMSLTRGFLYSGASNVMFSMWKVSDRYTHDLMVDFYKNFLENNNCPKSLRNSKLNMISNPYTSFPKYWAGFQLIGN